MAEHSDALDDDEERLRRELELELAREQAVHTDDVEEVAHASAAAAATPQQQSNGSIHSDPPITILPPSALSPHASSPTSSSLTTTSVEGGSGGVDGVHDVDAEAVAYQQSLKQYAHLFRPNPVSLQSHLHGSAADETATSGREVSISAVGESAVSAVPASQYVNREYLSDEQQLPMHKISWLPHACAYLLLPMCIVNVVLFIAVKTNPRNTIYSWETVHPQTENFLIVFSVFTAFWLVSVLLFLYFSKNDWLDNISTENEMPNFSSLSPFTWRKLWWNISQIPFTPVFPWAVEIFYISTAVGLFIGAVVGTYHLNISIARDSWVEVELYIFLVDTMLTYAYLAFIVCVCLFGVFKVRMTNSFQLSQVSAPHLFIIGLSLLLFVTNSAHLPFRSAGSCTVLFTFELCVGVVSGLLLCVCLIQLLFPHFFDRLYAKLSVAATHILIGAVAFPIIALLCLSFAALVFLLLRTSSCTDYTLMVFMDLAAYWFFSLIVARLFYVNRDWIFPTDLQRSNSEVQEERRRQRETESLGIGVRIEDL